jgi:hypothetical protein
MLMNPKDAAEMNTLMLGTKSPMLDVCVDPIVCTFQSPAAPASDAERVADQKAAVLRDYMAEHILSAGSAEEIDDRIEAVLDDGEYHRLVKELNDSVPHAAVARVLHEPLAPPKARFPRLTAIVGEPLMRNCDRLVGATLRVYIYVMLKTAVGSASSAETTAPPAPNLGLPPQLERSRYGVQVACAAVFALRAAEAQLHPDPDKVCHLVQRLIDGQRDYLRVFAGIPEVGQHIPTDLIPENERVDWQEMFARQTAANQGYQAALGEARRLGEDQYPGPVGRDE